MEENVQYKRTYKIAKTEMDRDLLIFVVALIVAGVMAVFSASLPMCMSKHINSFYYIGQHILWLILGGFGLFFFSKMDYNILKRYTFHFAIAIVVLLLLVKFTPLGVEINGARRWLNLGFFQFQPSEFSKLGIIMLLASWFSLDKKSFWAELPKYLLTILTMIFVVLKQPNLSMAIILCGICFCMYLCSGKSLKPILIGVVSLICVVILAKTNILNPLNFLEPFQRERILSKFSSTVDTQGSGYQVYHSLIAIASGGVFGQGYGASKEKLGWLPECHTDFIFSVVAEEMGFLGCLVIISFFVIFFRCGMGISINHPYLYGRFLACGITCLVTMQAFLNISVATSFMPATGITLPFISYGGSSLFVTMCMVGILLNISKTKLTKVTQKTTNTA